MPILKYNPFAELDNLPGELRVFQDSVARIMGDSANRPWTPPVDVIETENELMLKADVPEVDLKDIDIRLENGTLTLKGERKFEEQEKAVGYHRIERRYGSFARSFSLPETVDPDKVRAEYKNGVLTIMIPKKEMAKPRSIRVEVNS